jgi:hypothetical protein
MNAIYTVESGASKKRKKAKEISYWNSLNGPVVLISGSYNGRRVVSETNNEGPIPSPEAKKRIT